MIINDPISMHTELNSFTCLRAASKFVGLRFSQKDRNCASLVRDFLEEIGIQVEMPEYVWSPKSFERQFLSYLSKNAESIPVKLDCFENLEVCDILLFRTKASASVTHCGVYIGNYLFLSCREEANTVISNLYRGWAILMHSAWRLKVVKDR